MWMCAVVTCLLGSLDIPDGTIVVLENSNPIVRAVTKSEVTHVAMILNLGGTPCVYEATPQVVRHVSWPEYMAEIAALNRGRSAKDCIRVQLYHPSRRYTASEFGRLLCFVNSQLGRRYSLRGYVRGKPGDGIHCAEFVATALARTGRYPLPAAHAVNPAQLMSRLQATYENPRTIELPDPPSATWCQRSWQWWDTAFDWCGWACRESWTFCR